MSFGWYRCVHYNVAMNGSGTAVATLERIQALWDKLQRETPDRPQYEALAQQIHMLSAEYEALTNVSKKPKESN